MRVRLLFILLMLTVSEVVAAPGRALFADGTVITWAHSPNAFQTLDRRLPAHRVVVADVTARRVYLTRAGYDYSARAVEVFEVESLRHVATLPGVERVLIPADQRADVVLTESMIVTEETLEPYDPDNGFQGLASEFQIVDRERLQNRSGNPVPRSASAGWSPTNCVSNGAFLIQTWARQAVLGRSGLQERDADAGIPTLGLQGCWRNGFAWTKTDVNRLFDPGQRQDAKAEMPIDARENCSMVPELAADILCIRRERDGAPAFRIRRVNLASGGSVAAILTDRQFADADLLDEIGASDDGKIRFFRAMMLQRQERLRPTGAIVRVDLSGSALIVERLDTSDWPSLDVTWISQSAK
ncbi:hypothetical protein C7S18_02610 [Ahniella affigens]|uniref:Phytase-like domain-containing protein n=1 Tax=Ahniella affigens TaxID=2021234 RepID=A0A2P1PMT7_9GAMM|nr:hypothetical protein [Ahniella affigens]AVP96151.1 hypothetical protein C7S18_02610 [Ahniella affigens]